MQDPFLFAANLPGFLMSVSMLMRLYAIADWNVRGKIEWSLFLVSFFWFTLAFIITVFGDPTLLSIHESLSVESILGTGAVVACFGYYGFPLSTMAEVIRTRDSSSIEKNLATMSVVNASLWSLYGWFGINSAAVYIPNFAGLALSIVQMGLILTFPATPKEEDGESDIKTRTKSSSYDINSNHLQY